MRAAFADYLDAWGFRSSQELTLVAPTPFEDPLPTLRLLQMFLREGGDGPRAACARQARQREQATRALARQLSPRWGWVPLLSRAGRLRVLLRATQGAIALRERVRFRQALLYTRLRHVVLALGQDLVARGVLARADDVFFLDVDELDALAAGLHAYPEALPAVIAARRRAYDAAWQAEPPDTFALPRGATWADAPAPAPAVAGGAELTGASACGGTVTGRAAVIHDVADAARMQAGDVLVTRQTDPGWASVFFLVKGLVIERGGMLSHGAIIAREYGIPALVGVAQATKRIPHGQTVRVDADRGRVDLL